MEYVIDPLKFPVRSYQRRRALQAEGELKSLIVSLKYATPECTAEIRKLLGIGGQDNDAGA